MKEGWEYKKLGEIGTFIRGGNFSKKDFVENGFPCIHYGQIHMKFGVETLRNISSVPAEMVKNDRCAKKGDLVIAITSEDDAGSCKCTAWMGDYDVYVGGHTAIYRHTMQPKYVSYYFMSPYFQKDKLEYTHGFKVVEISPKDIAKISIPVPPLSEQQSIVDYLDTAFAKIDAMKANAEKALNEAKALFQASLKEMLEPKEGWEEKKLKEVVISITDGDHQPPPKAHDGIPFITISNIDKSSNKIVFEDTFYVPQSYFRALKKDRIPQNGDVLYTVTGSFGIPVLIDFQKEFCFQRHIALIRPNMVLLSPTYLFYWILSSYAICQAEDTATGAAQRTVSLNSLRNFTIHVPLLPEQQSIVETLDSLKSKVDRLQENYAKISQECAALKQAILRQVFE